MHVNAYWIKIKYKSYLQFSTVYLKSYTVTFHVQKTNQETNKNLRLKTQNKKKLKNRRTQAREEYTSYWYHLNIKKKTNCMHSNSRVS